MIARDVRLVKTVHEETHDVCGIVPPRYFTIQAIMNDCGELNVYVVDQRRQVLWEGCSIIYARNWLLDVSGRVKRHLVFGTEGYDDAIRDGPSGRIISSLFSA